MGRQKMPDMPEEMPVFPNEAAAVTPAGLPLKYIVQEGAIPQPGMPVQSAMRSSSAASLVEPPKVRRFRVDNLPPGGRQYVDQQGRHSRLVPGKLLDERYFPIEFIRRQGFTLVEVGENEQQIGVKM